MKHLNLKLIITILGLILSIHSYAMNWPQKITTSKGEITIYQPQTESIDGINLSGRAAVSVKTTDGKPIFGAIWIDAILQNDRASRMSTLTEVKIPKVKFSDDVSDENIEKLKSIILNEIPKWDWEIPTDEIITTYEDDVTTHGDDYKNDAPEVVVAYEPSMLIYIDGEPITEDIDGYNNLAQVINTPYCVLQDTKKGTYYVYGEGRWYESKYLDKGWSEDRSPSSSLKDIQKQIEENNSSEDDELTSDKSDEALNIIVRTHQAELLQIYGDAEMSAVKNTNLLYVSNSDSYIFFDIDSQDYYVMLSGRWYKAKAIDNTWTYVPSNELPETFANIPEGSSLDVVLANIPGTDASKEAILDNTIPQTAEVSRADATVSVDYDGTPVYKNVSGTSMQYVENSAQTVIRDGNKYYCVDDGIWFVSKSPNGPWEVATVRPQQVEEIQPESPVYNVKYVYIYDVTPEVVYVGYTPGYYGSYVYNNTVIYGTGYYYRPWYGRYYYPRATTFGFSMNYNPWAGWSVGFGWSYNGWFNVGWGYHAHYGGYWGAPSYRPPYCPPHQHNGYYGRRSSPVYYAPRRSQNVYASHRSGVKTRTPSRVSSSRNSGRSNNVYTDRNGQVYRRTGDTWKRRTDNSWEGVRTSRTSNGSASRVSNSSSTGRTPNVGTTTGRTTNTSSSTSRNPSTSTTTNRTPNSSSSSSRQPSTSTTTSRTPSSSSSSNRVSSGSSSSGRTSSSSSSRTNSGFSSSRMQNAAQSRQRSQVRTSSYSRSTNTGVSRSSSSRSTGVRSVPSTSRSRR